MGKCSSCANAQKFVGAYTQTCWIECRIANEFCNSHSIEEIVKAHKENVNFCNYKEGRPVYCGLTFDD